MVVLGAWRWTSRKAYHAGLKQNYRNMSAASGRHMRTFIAVVVFLASIAAPAAAQLPPPEIGIVVMHGKGGAPTKLVAGLAKWLGNQGYRVANLEMPWSGQRNYDKTVPEAVAEVDAALASLRSQGARKVFVCGHSLGGL